MSAPATRDSIFIRAQYDDDSWGNVDVFDLDDDSFRAVVLGALAGCFCALTPEKPPLPLRAKPGIKKED